MRAALAVLLAVGALAAPASAAPPDPWFARADAHCASATREAKRLLETVPAIRTHAGVIAFLHAGVRLQARLYEQLRAADPPAPDARVRRFMRLFGRSVALDRRSVAELEQSADQAKLGRWITEGQKLEGAARRIAATVGLRACERYFDPKTYA